MIGTINGPAPDQCGGRRAVSGPDCGVGWKRETKARFRSSREGVPAARLKSAPVAKVYSCSSARGSPGGEREKELHQKPVGRGGRS